MKILRIGESAIDKVRIIQNNTKNLQLFSITESQHIGGSVLAALILLSRLNLDCTFLTSIGKDNKAEVIKRKLVKENVKLIANFGEKTKENIIVINSQNGQREKLRGDIEHSPIKDIPTEFIRQFDLIIIDRHEREAFYEIIRKKKFSSKIVIDPSTEVSDFTLDMIKYADYPILPIEFLVKIGEGKDLTICLQTLYKICNKSITVTAGELGSITYDGKKLNLIPALRIKAVDTTGAGDIYRSAFAYGIIRRMNLNQCATFANLVAALQCTKLGNVTAIPSKNEIKLFIDLSIQRKLLTLSKVNNYFSELDQSI